MGGTPKPKINLRRYYMNAVGIDVSKGKSMVAALRPMGEVTIVPRLKDFLLERFSNPKGAGSVQKSIQRI